MESRLVHADRATNSLANEFPTGLEGFEFCFVSSVRLANISIPSTVRLTWKNAGATTARTLGSLKVFHREILSGMKHAIQSTILRFSALPELPISVEYLSRVGAIINNLRRSLFGSIGSIIHEKFSEIAVWFRQIAVKLSKGSVKVQ